MAYREPATNLEDIPVEQLYLIVGLILKRLNLEIVRVKGDKAYYYDLRPRPG